MRIIPRFTQKSAASREQVLAHVFLLPHAGRAQHVNRDAGHNVCHHYHGLVPGQQAGQPDRDPHRGLGAGAGSQVREPLAGGSGLVVDDVEDTFGPTLDGEDRCAGGVVEVDPGAVAGGLAYQGVLPLADQLDL